MEETLDRALKFADLIASGEILSFLTVDEATEEIIGLLGKLDTERRKQFLQRISSFLINLNERKEGRYGWTSGT